MRIVALSDTHCKHDQVIVPEGDVLIHAGDLTPRGNYNEFISVARWFSEMSSRFRHRIFIAGNHDFALDFNSKRVLQGLFDESVIYLEDSEVVIDGIKIYGSPWTPIFYNWAFMGDESELAAKFSLIPEDTDVLITHGPPLGILDKNANKEKCGSGALYQRIKELKKLKVHIFGHIHEGFGEEVIDDVRFYNVSSLNGYYQYKNAPVVIEV